jgi:hypothetical protein
MRPNIGRAGAKFDPGVKSLLIVNKGVNIHPKGPKFAPRAQSSPLLANLLLGVAHVEKSELYILHVCTLLFRSRSWPGFPRS